MRVAHAERREDVLAEGRVEVLARDRFDDPSHPVGGCAVDPVGARLEQERSDLERVAVWGLKSRTIGLVNE